MINLVKKGLEQILRDIDSDSCNMSESDISEVIDLINKINTRSTFLNRTEAAEYLHMSQRTFDRQVHDGYIPKGEHHRGDKQLTWRKSDLEKLAK